MPHGKAHGHHGHHEENHEQHQSYDFDPASTYKKHEDGSRTGKLLRNGVVVRDFDAENSHFETTRERLEHNSKTSNIFGSYSEDEQRKMVANPKMFFTLEGYVNSLIYNLQSGSGSTPSVNTSNLKPTTNGKSVPVVSPKKEPEPEDEDDGGMFDLFG